MNVFLSHGIFTRYFLKLARYTVNQMQFPTRSAIHQGSPSEYPGGGSSQSPIAHGDSSCSSNSRIRAVNISFLSLISESTPGVSDPALEVLRIDSSRRILRGGELCGGVCPSRSSMFTIFSCAARSSFRKRCRRTVLMLLRASQVS